jgi:uncharacterized protein (DUF736 family)
MKGESTQGKRFSQWYSELDSAHQLDFFKKARARVRRKRLVHDDDVHDLTADAFEALLNSATLYPYIHPKLVALKAAEIAQTHYWGRPASVELTDIWADPGDNALETMLARDAAEEDEQAYKASVREIYTVVTSAHREFLGSIIEMSLDPTIGQFRHENGVFTGKVRTPTGGLSVRIVPTALSGSDYIAMLAGSKTKIGVAWNRTDEKKPTRYVWLKLDSPFLPAPAYCSLLHQPDGSYDLIWHRPDSLADAPYREGEKRPQFNNQNIARHRAASVEQVEGEGDAIRKRLQRRPDIAEPIKARLKGRPISTSPIAGSGRTNAKGAEDFGACRRTSDQSAQSARRARPV